MKVSLSLVLSALGLAMSVAAVVLMILKASTAENAILLLGIGMFCLSLDALQRSAPEEKPPVRKPTPAGNKRRK